jgi:hypothetical protein
MRYQTALNAVYISGLFCSPSVNRTHDKVINSHSLYQLSYREINTIGVFHPHQNIERKLGYSDLETLSTLLQELLLPLEKLR